MTNDMNSTSLEQKLEYTFRDRELFERSLTHKSFSNEFPEESNGNNERLEFLGDAVLDLVISEELMRLHPERDEGFLSVQRANLVSEPALAILARDFGMDEMIRLGRGEKKTHGENKPRLLSSVFEAVVGALYQDGGYEVCRRFVATAFAELLTGERVIEIEQDSKSALQTMVQEKFKSVPVYKLDSEEGPDHDKVFFVSVWVEGKEKARGDGRTKKIAEQKAAKSAIENWESE